jgi:hypothetical protein
MKVRLPLAAAMGSILIPLAGAQLPRAQSKARPQAAQQKLAQPPPPPPAAPTMAAARPSAEQMPATPPQVAFNGGILTITAKNSTLGDILRAVHHQTGASVDVPGNATERVVGIFGPGPARDVMASLLNGSHFNYVLLGSETDPSGLDKVVLLSKSGGEESPVQQARFSGRGVPSPQPAENADSANDDDSAADMTQDANEATDEQANQGQAEEQPQAQQPGQPGIKTPEQLLQELQQRQQQMQQQQGTQGAPVPPQGFPPSPMGTPQQK